MATESAGVDLISVVTLLGAAVVTVPVFKRIGLGSVLGYLAAGLEPSGNELPDFLPLFLDYCSTLPEQAAREALAEPGVVMVAIAARLAERESDYAPVFELLCAIAGVEMDEEAKNAIPPADDPQDLEELDAQWEEEEIRFGAEAAPDPNAACPVAARAPPAPDKRPSGCCHRPRAHALRASSCPLHNGLQPHERLGGLLQSGCLGGFASRFGDGECRLRQPNAGRELSLIHISEPTRPY